MNEAMNVTINICNELGVELEDGMLNDVLRCVARHIPQARVVKIYPAARVPEDAEPYKYPGWLEWIIRIEYRGGSGLTIGAIQRTIGAETEFHS